MDDHPEHELQFPCSFPLKAIGRGGDDFQELVINIIRKHIRDLDEDAVVSRPSEHGNYLSVTATFTAESKEQLDDLYRELNSSERVLMVL